MRNQLLHKVRIFARGSLKNRGKLPTEVQLEITNRCNFQCPMCPRKSVNAPNEDMRPNVLERAVEQLAGVKTVTLTGWGEPLYHSDISVVLKTIRARWPKIAIHITTNGSFLKGDLAKQILEYKVDQLSVSMDRVLALGGDKGHNNPWKVGLNIKRFMKMRKNGLPRMILQPTLRVGSLYDLFDLLEYAKDTGVDGINLVRLDTSLSPGLKRPTLEEEREMVAELRYRAADNVPIGYANHYNLPMNIASHGETVCFRTVYHVYITVDGEVTPCCLLRNRSMGNIADHSLGEIWTSPAYNRFFKNQNTICGACDALTTGHKNPKSPQVLK